MARRNPAEQMLEEVKNSILESQNGLEKFVSGRSNSNLSIDVIEGVTEITVIIDIPGVTKDNVTINVSEDTLEVDAVFSEEITTEEVNYVKRERRQGAVRRVVSLPSKIVIDDATANFEEGVLTVTLPKVESKETLKVNIN